MGPWRAGADGKGSGRQADAASTFIPPHQLSRQEDFTFSFTGASPSATLKRERLRARNAILRSTGTGWPCWWPPLLAVCWWWWMSGVVVRQTGWQPHPRLCCAPVGRSFWQSLCSTWFALPDLRVLLCTAVYCCWVSCRLPGAFACRAAHPSSSSSSGASSCHTPLPNDQARTLRQAYTHAPVRSR